MSNKVELGFNAEVRAALKQFNEAKALADQAEAMKAEAEAILRAALGGAEAATIGGVVAFRIEHRTRTNVSTKALKEQFPKAYEALATTSEYDFLKALATE
jgi:predicted phage-related endonuclease